MAVSRFFSPIFSHFSPKSEKCRFEPTLKKARPARLSGRKSLISNGFRRVRGLQKRPQNGHPRHSCIKDSNQFDSNVAWVRIPPSAPKAAPCGVLLFIFVANFARVARWDSNSPCPALCVPPATVYYNEYTGLVCRGDLCVKSNIPRSHPGKSNNRVNRTGRNYASPTN